MRYVLLSLWLGAIPPAPPDPGPRVHDIVVYGGTSAGISAAVQAERMGNSIVVVSPDLHLGGLSSGGLGWTDSGRKEAIGGLARDFYRRIKAHYDRPEAWTRRGIASGAEVSVRALAYIAAGHELHHARDLRRAAPAR